MGRTGPGVALVVAALALSGCGSALPTGRSAPQPTTQTRVAPGATGEGGAEVDPADVGDVDEAGDAGDVGGAGEGISSGRDTPAVKLPTGPVFPLTLRRTGGIADFHDTVVLDDDGLVTVDTTSIAGRTCRLTAPQRATLLVGLSTLRLGGSTPAPRDASGPAPSVDGETPTDPITVTVTDVNARPVDLTDPSLGQISALVSALITDVTLTTPATTSCTDAPGGAGSAG